MRVKLILATTVCLLMLPMSGRAEIVTSLGKLQMVKRYRTKVLDHATEYRFSRDLVGGRMRKAQEGRKGEIKVRVDAVMVGDKPIFREETVVSQTEAQPEIFEIGRPGFNTSRGSFSRARVMQMTSTAYTPYDGSSTGRTATGRRAGYGIVAVDPRVISLGTLVYVEGYGFALAADTGGAIKGNKIDVCFPTNSECRRWGRKKVTVHVFKERLQSGKSR
ncbi:MAG: 3D domain-containing protein [Fimbriimonadaceae bacterium]|nr:3D domain-containing protein [Fimbriimonadaceae bacterium]QYK57075.1 MAG: 3D domain-containing protein [Fimbriimonadaceae bacterium]